jgi:hypothetical protein
LQSHWSRPKELFARAGAQFAHYELHKLGARNDYLVFGAAEPTYANHPRGNPNPTSADRLALQSHFHALLADASHRLRPMDTRVHEGRRIADSTRDGLSL